MSFYYLYFYLYLYQYLYLYLYLLTGCVITPLNKYREGFKDVSNLSHFLLLWRTHYCDPWYLLIVQSCVRRPLLPNICSNNLLRLWTSLPSSSLFLLWSTSYKEHYNSEGQFCKENKKAGSLTNHPNCQSPIHSCLRWLFTRNEIALSGCF